MAKAPNRETVKVTSSDATKVREAAKQVGVVLKNFPTDQLPSMALIEYAASKGMDLTYSTVMGPAPVACMIPKSGNNTGSNGSAFNGPWKVTDLTEDLETVLSWACAQSKAGTATKAVTGVTASGNVLHFTLKNGQTFTASLQDDRLTKAQQEQQVRQAPTTSK